MVRAATLHPIYEHARVEEFARDLPSATSLAELTRLGELMFGAALVPVRRLAFPALPSA